MSQNNVKITFPDGSVREYPQGVTPFQIAESISQRLAQEVLSATVNGKVVDLAMPVNQEASVKLNKWEDPEGKATFWHTSSHLLAEALESLYPGIKFGIGPSIENGFYYDVDSPVPITEADLPKIEKKMEELAENGLAYDGKCYISHSACQADAEAVASLVESRFPNLNGRVLINSIGTTIGSHTGPGTVALFFWGEERKS